MRSIWKKISDIATIDGIRGLLGVGWSSIFYVVALAFGYLTLMAEEARQYLLSSLNPLYSHPSFPLSSSLLVGIAIGYAISRWNNMNKMEYEIMGITINCDGIGKNHTMDKSCPRCYHRVDILGNDDECKIECTNKLLCRNPVNIVIRKGKEEEVYNLCQMVERVIWNEIAERKRYRILKFKRSKNHWDWLKIQCPSP